MSERLCLPPPPSIAFDATRTRGRELSFRVSSDQWRGRRRRRALSTLRIGLAVADVAMPGVTRVSELKLAFVAPLAWPPSWDGGAEAGRGDLVRRRGPCSVDDGPDKKPLDRHCTVVAAVAACRR